ncbi:hypothetical protein V7S76_12630 [Aquirufa sp. ROCK2-A2]
MKILRIANLLSFLAVLTMNFLSVKLPLNGHTPGELSDLYVNYFVPAGFTFSIWGIIYTYTFIWVIAQTAGLFSESLSAKSDFWVNRIGWNFVFSSIANIAWLCAWHYEQLWLSVVIMLVLLGILIKNNIQLETTYDSTSRFYRWAVKIPFQIYFGWICVATIANFTAALVGNQWTGFGISEVLWTKIMLSIAIALGMVLVYLKRGPFIGLTIVWALWGIYSKRLSIDTTASQEIASWALVGVIWLGTVSVVKLGKRY